MRTLATCTALIITCVAALSSAAQESASQPVRKSRDSAESQRLRNLAKAATRPAPPAASMKAPTTGVSALRHEAASLEMLVQSDVAKAFIHAASELPEISQRTIYRTKDRTAYYTAKQAEQLSAERRKELDSIPINESLYYTTKYGTPLAYARPLDLLGQAGLRDVAGMKILDFGYGTVGHLRLLATLGAEVVGVDVDPLLPALYGEPGDQGVIQGRHGRKGKITLVNGR